MNDDIREIAVSIWETLFTIPLEDGVLGDGLGDPVVTGCVHIDGSWHGAVMLQYGEGLASLLAGQLFRSEAPVSEEILDTIGELTNMLAGNIKALLPQPSGISLPTVAIGADYALTVMGTRVINAVAFRCGDLPLLVTVLQSTADVAT